MTARVGWSCRGLLYGHAFPPTYFHPSWFPLSSISDSQALKVRAGGYRYLSASDHVSSGGFFKRGGVEIREVFTGSARNRGGGVPLCLVVLVEEE